MSVLKTRMGYSEARIVKAATWFRKRLSNVEHGIKILPHFIAQHHQNLIAKAHANLALTIAWRASATLIDDELRCAKGGAGTGNPARVSSEERRVGQEWVSPCRSRWSRYP